MNEGYDEDASEDYESPYDWTDAVCCAIPPRLIGTRLELSRQMRAALICCLPRQHTGHHNGTVTAAEGSGIALRITWDDTNPTRLNCPPGDDPLGHS